MSDLTWRMSLTTCRACKRRGRFQLDAHHRLGIETFFKRTADIPDYRARAQIRGRPSLRQGASLRLRIRGVTEASV